MTPKHSIARSSAFTTAATVVTMLTSFSAQIVIAKLFGASAELDAYLTAGALPLASTGVLSAAIGYITLPALAEQREDSEKLARMTGHFAAAVAGLAALAGIGGSLLARPLAHWIAPGLQPDKLLLAERLEPLLWGATSLMLISSLLISLHHFRRRFVLPTLSGAVVFLSVIAFGLALTPRFGIVSLAWGYLAGAGAQCLLLLPILGEGFHFRLQGLTASAQSFLGTAVPVMGSLLPFTLLGVIDAYWASRLPDGSLSCLGYSTRIVNALVGITVQGLAIVLFPFLADNAVAGEFYELRRRLRNALKFILVIELPILALLAVLRVPVLKLMFERGSFDQQATLRLAAVLPWYLVGMIGMAAMNILVRVFYAISRPGIPALLGMACLAGYAGLSGMLSSIFSYPGIGIAYAIYWTGLCLIAGIALGKRIGGFWGLEDWQFAGKLGVVAAAAGLAVYAAERWIPAGFGALARVAGLGLLGTLSLVALDCILFRASEIRLLYSMIRMAGRAAGD